MLSPTIIDDRLLLNHRRDSLLRCSLSLGDNLIPTLIVEHEQSHQRQDPSNSSPIPALRGCTPIVRNRLLGYSHLHADALPQSWRRIHLVTLQYTLHIDCPVLFHRLLFVNSLILLANIRLAK